MPKITPVHWRTLEKVFLAAGFQRGIFSTARESPLKYSTYKLDNWSLETGEGDGRRRMEDRSSVPGHPSSVGSIVDAPPFVLLFGAGCATGSSRSNPGSWGGYAVGLPSVSRPRPVPGLRPRPREPLKWRSDRLCAPRSRSQRFPGWSCRCSRCW
jgi:hypothetical protein